MAALNAPLLHIRNMFSPVPVVMFIVVLSTAIGLHYHELDRFLNKPADSLGYYQYLPAVFVHHDLLRMPWAIGLPNGNTLSLASIGVAWLQLPFFLVAHAIAPLVGHGPSGFSPPYTIAQFIGTAVYTALAFRFLYVALRRSYARHIVVWVLTVLLFGTNLFYYAAWEPAMSHSYAFFLFAWLLYLSVRINERSTDALVFQWLVCGALLLVIRPLHALGALLPLFYGISSLEALLARIRVLSRHRVGLCLGLLAGAVPVFSQLLYWHAVSGRWLLFSYGEAGQSFDWSAPHLLDVLFSHQNGWLIYSPLMLPIMFTLVAAAVRKRAGARMILFVWGVTWYIYACWWAWWLGAAYGFRGFTELLALLSLPAVWCVACITRWSPRVRYAAAAVCGFLLFFNLRLTILYSGSCCWDGPDWTWARLTGMWARALWLS